MKIEKEQIVKILRPSIKQILGIAGVGLASLALVNYNLILLQLTRGTLFEKEEVQNSFAVQLKTWTSSPLLNLATLVIFWVSVGLVAYAVIYWLYNIINEARNEVTVEEEYVNRGSKEERVKWPLIQLGILGIILLFGVLTVFVLFPLWNSLFEGFVTGLIQAALPAVGMLLGAVIGMSITIYVFRTLVIAALILE